jgi:hypothetical protein
LQVESGFVFLCQLLLKLDLQSVLIEAKIRVFPVQIKDATPGLKFEIPRALTDFPSYFSGVAIN